MATFILETLVLRGVVAVRSDVRAVELPRLGTSLANPRTSGMANPKNTPPANPAMRAGADDGQPGDVQVDDYSTSGMSMPGAGRSRRTSEFATRTTANATRTPPALAAKRGGWCDGGEGRHGEVAAITAERQALPAGLAGLAATHAGASRWLPAVAQSWRGAC